VDQALNSLYTGGMKSLIIDLRGNPGGLLTTCVEISDRFLACGTIVSTKGRLGGDNMLETATYAKTWNVPMVVLVDGDSASASEIFAAAIQENERGVVVGTKSYGKGSVQTHFPLNAIGGDLRLTTALFYSPTGRKMAGQGVTPDVEINDRDGVANGDEVLVEAVRIARSQTLKAMAKASGTCRPATPSAGRSSSLSNFVDPSHIGSAVR
jgi:carboxyl-terminal processing protease